MGSGEDRVDQIGEVEFNGQVGKNIAKYAQLTQRFGHDLAAEFDISSAEALAAMRKLKHHPRMQGVNVRRRSRQVARHISRARELAQGISAEAVKFYLQYRREFIEIERERDDEGRQYRRYTGGVDL